MAGKLKKGKEGNVLKYISRSQAIKKLQITLTQFRRLCILKGIYPVEPKNKRQLAKGSTTWQTYYFRKDIQFLLHEPVLRVLREQRSHKLKLNKAIGKREFVVAKRLYENRPVYTLDHIIKERYPCFVDALRDLDDALSMIFLFATISANQHISAAHIRECQRLSAEFQHYVIISRSLKKTFVSIKGIYYQAEIRGQLITWITPFQFSQDAPIDVDFRVMDTFLEIYEPLVGFVNYKLYSDLNLVYPPKISTDSETSAIGLSAFIIESRENEDVVQSVSIAADGPPTAMGNQVSQSAQRLKTLNQKIGQIEAAQDSDSDMSDTAGIIIEENGLDANGGNDEQMDIPAPISAPTTLEETVPTLASWKASESEHAKSARLFSSCVFWLPREVSRNSLEFIIKSFGGKVGWDASSGSGSPYQISDSCITHHVCDRPVQTVGQLPIGVERFESREYIQPQWVYDSVNAGRLIKTAGYHPGDTLPPHLSPFVSVEEGDYIPEQDMDVDAEVAVAEVEDLEATSQAELEAEAAGVQFSNYDKASVPHAKNAALTVADKKKSMLTETEQEDREAKELAKNMMSKRDKKLYDGIQKRKEKKAEHVEILKNKKRALKKHQN
ncbi:mRNA-binding ribosome synthesis protein nop7 [Batrachochytrium dendrobatidis]|nr:mRNA-binding ribosome synthesis protein nop7 [Batrachochytrium dendrobatidis]